MQWNTGRCENRQFMVTLMKYIWRNIKIDLGWKKYNSEIPNLFWKSTTHTIYLANQLHTWCDADVAWSVSCGGVCGIWGSVRHWGRAGWRPPAHHQAKWSHTRYDRCCPYMQWSTYWPLTLCNVGVNPNMLLGLCGTLSTLFLTYKHTPSFARSSSCINDGR